MADHAVTNHGVHAIKEAVIEIKTARVFSGFGRKLLIFLAEFYKIFSHKAELHRVVHVNACEFVRMAPECFRQRSGIRNRVIEMHRSDMKPVFLPESK